MAIVSMRDATIVVDGKSVVTDCELRKDWDSTYWNLEKVNMSLIPEGNKISIFPTSDVSQGSPHWEGDGLKRGNVSIGITNMVWLNGLL